MATIDLSLWVPLVFLLACASAEPLYFTCDAPSKLLSPMDTPTSAVLHPPASDLLRSAYMLPNLFTVQHFELSNQCNDFYVLTNRHAVDASCREPHASATSALDGEPSISECEDLTPISPDAAPDATSSGLRSSLQLVPYGGSWRDGCEMKMVCTTEYTRLPLDPATKQNPLLLLHLVASVLVGLLAARLAGDLWFRMAAGGLGGLFTLLAVLIVVAYKLLLPGKAKGLVNILLMAGVMSVYQVGSMYTLLLGNSIRWLWGAIWMDSASGSMSMFGVVLVMTVMGSAFVGAFVVKAYTESLVVQDCIAWILRVIAYTSCYYAVPDDYFAFGVISFLLLSTVQYPLFEALFRTCISILPSQLHKSPKVSRPAADKCVRFSPLTQSRIFAPTERTSPMNPRDPAVGAPLIPADPSPVEREPPARRVRVKPVSSRSPVEAITQAASRPLHSMSLHLLRQSCKQAGLAVSHSDDKAALITRLEQHTSQVAFDDEPEVEDLSKRASTRALAGKEVFKPAASPGARKRRTSTSTPASSGSKTKRTRKAMIEAEAMEVDEEVQISQPSKPAPRLTPQALAKMSVPQLRKELSARGETNVFGKKDELVARLKSLQG